MASAYALCLSLCAAVLGFADGCPELCTCSDKYGRQFAECSYKNLDEIPEGLPPNVTTLSLSANKLTLVQAGCFDNVTMVTSLWMGRNEIVSIEEGTLAPLVQLRNFDISYNRIVDFPWEDLRNLTALQLLKMNHNRISSLPKDAFSNLKDLRSLRLNNNRFTTLAEGTFDGLISLSHLQLYNNPFTCSCSMDWLRDWLSKTTVSVPEPNSTVCASPEHLKGAVIVKLAESKCMAPNVTIVSQPNIDNTTIYDSTLLILNCETEGNPKPEVIWKINTKGQNTEFPLSSIEDESEEYELEEPEEDSKMSDNQFQLFPNGTLVISHLALSDSGSYSCLATNEFGRAEGTVAVVVVSKPKPNPPPPVPKVFKPLAVPQNNPSVRQPVVPTSVYNAFNLPHLERKDNTIPTLPQSIDIDTQTEYIEQAPMYPSRAASKCGLSSDTQYTSNHAFNGTLDDVKQYMFDFGVVALGVSETDAKVRLNPLLLPKDKTDIRLIASEGFHSVSKEPRNQSELSRKSLSDGLYLCVTADPQRSAVQWSRIEDGVNTYLFQGLHPGTNYSLCLTYRGEDCDVQVIFTTKKRIPNLLIIISVSICLLTVSTVPLLGATCFHLVYKYRGKTYKLIMKAKDQYHMDRNLAANFNLRTAYAESQRKINVREIDEAEGESESGTGEREGDGDVEGSVVTESFTLSQYRSHLDECEVGSEYSDRLPLGAEAVNIIGTYKFTGN